MIKKETSPIALNTLPSSRTTVTEEPRLQQGFGESFPATRISYAMYPSRWGLQLRCKRVQLLYHWINKFPLLQGQKHLVSFSFLDFTSSLANSQGRTKGVCVLCLLKALNTMLINKARLIHSHNVLFKLHLFLMRCFM